MCRMMNLNFFLLHFLLLPICLLLLLSLCHHSNAVQHLSHLAGGDSFSRNDLVLLYQRLKSGDGGGRFKGTGVRSRPSPAGNSTRDQQQQKQQEGRRKIVRPPLVNAVLSASSSVVPSSARPRPTLSPRSPSLIPRSTSSAGRPTSSPSAPPPLPQHLSLYPSFLHFSQFAAIIFLGCFFSLATTIGNALVMLSICVDRKLQTISNYFLFSLAVADLIIGIISIPLMTIYTANGSWPFGYAFCQFWLCIDYLMCNASVLNLLLISFDRYFSVTRPLSYRPKRTTRKTMTMIGCSYLLSLLIWTPWIVLWPYLEDRFIVEENALCVVQFLALGDRRNWRNQLATLITAALAFYIPVTLMIVLYYKVYLETRKRQKELRKLQDGQQIRGLQSTVDAPPLPCPRPLLVRNLSIQSHCSLKQQPPSTGGKINFMEFVNNFTTVPLGVSGLKKKERFSLLKFCTGRTQTDISSEDSNDDVAAMDENSYGAGMTTSNLDSILADNTPIELAPSEEGREREERGLPREGSANAHLGTLDLSRTSRPSSVHTYNSIVIIEYPDSQRGHDRPSVRLSSHAEVESISARNSVERRLETDQPRPKDNIKGEKTEEQLSADKQKLRQTKSCPQAAGWGRAPTQQQNGLMKKSEIALLREEQNRRSEKERRRNERKQESKAAKTLSAILLAFIITWTPYNVIVCLEAFYPNSVPASLFTLSYFLCYVNSTINPLCYALCNARFRMTYLRIIKCKWRRACASPYESSFGRTSSGRRILLKGRQKSGGGGGGLAN